MLRSEPMSHGTLILPIEHAREYVDLLGLRASIQFEDMNAVSYLRPYRTYVQRITDMECSLRFIQDEIRSLPGWEDEIQGGDVDGFLARRHEYTLNGVEAELNRLRSEFTILKESMRGLLIQRNNTTEALYVARLASCFHTPQQTKPHGAAMTRTSLLRRLSGDASGPALSSERAETRRGSDQFELQALMRPPEFQEYGIAVGPAEVGRPLGGGVDTMAGVVSRDAQARFARALFRAMRGNVYTHFVEIHEPLVDPKTNREAFKSVFVIYFQRQIMLQTANSAREKITRVCNAFDAHVYPWCPDHASAEAAKASLQQQVTDQAVLLEQARKYMRQQSRMLIERVTYPEGNSLIEEWRMFCAKEKAVYATLNCFEGKDSLRACCWYPASEEQNLRTTLARHIPSSRAMLVPDRSQLRLNPPTYFQRNELTAATQELVNMYGMPRYQEANPALFSVVTFPFLFGMMYGDVGHGLLLFLFGLSLWLHADFIRKISPEVHMLRYLIVAMGFFATYAGFLYNDFFSIGLELFDSRWKQPIDAAGTVEYMPIYDVRNHGGQGPYPFGLDPAWHGAVNELIFVNSMKMKMSVIVGVVHMILGLFLRCANAFHERSIIDFVFECVPMMVFMVCFFGFMDAMIVYKWVTLDEKFPSIINSMICMALPMNKDKAPMFGDALPRYMMLATLISAFLMLFPKPFILLYLHRAHDRKKENTPEPQLPLRAFEDVCGGSFTIIARDESDIEVPSSPLLNLLEDGEEQFEFMEVLMHQIIHTIEYTLGTVSHTASYLRLWALSLAHQQLSHVFFEQTLGRGMCMLNFPFNGIVLYIMFTAWFAITLAVFFGMDLLECTMHTLRLHWVEFQSKFYRADGYPFTPYSHKDVLEQQER